MDDDDRLYADIGRRVRQARAGFGGEPWTQEQLGTRVGLTRSSIANLEAGRQRIPVHTLYAIAQTLRVPVEDLLPAREPAQRPAPFEFADDVPASSRAFVLACLAQL